MKLERHRVELRCSRDLPIIADLFRRTKHCRCPSSKRTIKLLRVENISKLCVNLSVTSTRTSLSEVRLSKRVVRILSPPSAKSFERSNPGPPRGDPPARRSS